jgi:AcrR family transcriptional regulator
LAILNSRLTAPRSARKARGFGHQRRLEILAAAERIFVAYGYDGATIRKIAAEVGVSPTALYMHFADKHAMLMEIGGNAADRLAAEASAIAAQAADPVERLRGILATHIRFALKNPTAYRIVFCEGARDPDRADLARDMSRGYYKVLSGVTAELETGGRLLNGKARVIAQVLFMACHGLVSQINLNPGADFAPASALSIAMLDGLVRGHVGPKT